jgi:hypothetical protein
MNMRNREWLRSFLRLGARAEKDGIPAAAIERQEDTVLRALAILDDQPGVVFADEVGMGKTYEALGIAAVTRHERPRSRIVVVTPGPDLNSKWVAEFARFREMFDFGDEVLPARHLREFVQGVRRHAIVVAPVTMFQSGRGSGAQTYLLSLYFHWRQLHGHTANAIMARFRDGDQERVDVRSARFLDTFTLDEVTPHLQQAFRRGKASKEPGLDDLYETGGLSAFENEYAVKHALYRARFVLTGRLMPMIDLLVVDEAHKLKNPGSLRTRAMREVFRKRFGKALFLTATPFQLDVDELREVFALFATAKQSPPDLLNQVDGLLSAVREYQHRYDEFQATWSMLDPAVAGRFRTAYDRDPASVRDLNDPALTVVAAQAESLRDLKVRTIEPGFRRWMIRSLREEKRKYRQHQRKDIRAADEQVLPFLIYERFIAELFRRRRQTHKAAAEINMVSSYAAAQQGSLIAGGDGIPPEAEAYRRLLKDILEATGSVNDDHPKLRTAIADALDAADRDEKTLIFCSRIATLEQLRRDLDREWECRLLERWRRVYPGASTEQVFDTVEDDDSRQRGLHSLLQARFHRPQDALYLALRECYCRTLLPVSEWALGHLTDVLHGANTRLQSVRVGRTSAERIDYLVAKRCIEQAAAALWSSSSTASGAWTEVTARVCDPKFLRFGLENQDEESLEDAGGEESPTWEISERVARMVLGEGGSLWETLSPQLAALSVALRVRLVEQLARYLTFKQVPFLADLLAEGRRVGLVVEPVESAAFLQFLPRFWLTPTGQRWVQRLRTFTEYFAQRDPVQQTDILDGPLRSVRFVRHTRDGESREQLREAFNTPLYPMILVANEVMQEGLDLHKHCRRVVHHDLLWNPAQIEQRIGRIDRLGSLTERLRKGGANATLDVLYPIICGTIDQRMYRTVKGREKWLEFLLGAPPSFSDYGFSDDEPPPLPDRLALELAIDLGPK